VALIIAASPIPTFDPPTEVVKLKQLLNPRQAFLFEVVALKQLLPPTHTSSKLTPVVRAVPARYPYAVTFDPVVKAVQL
jgi:hypothetical protein